MALTDEKRRLISAYVTQRITAGGAPDMLEAVLELLGMTAEEQDATFKNAAGAAKRQRETDLAQHDGTARQRILDDIAFFDGEAKK